MIAARCGSHAGDAWPCRCHGDFSQAAGGDPDAAGDGCNGCGSVPMLADDKAVAAAPA